MFLNHKLVYLVLTNEGQDLHRATTLIFLRFSGVRLDPLDWTQIGYRMNWGYPDGFAAQSC